MKWVGACVNLRRQWFPHALPRALNAASGGLCVWFTAVPKKEDGWCSARQDRFSPGRGNLNCTSDCGLSSGSSASGCHKSLARGSKAAGPTDASWQRSHEVLSRVLFLAKTHIFMFSCSILFIHFHKCVTSPNSILSDKGFVLKSHDPKGKNIPLWGHPGQAGQRRTWSSPPLLWRPPVVQLHLWRKRGVEGHK